MKKESKYELLQKKFAPFFKTEYRMGTERGSKILIIDDGMFSEFINELINTNEIPDSFKLLCILQLSGAMRISETLELKVSQIDCASRMINSIRVLKKRHKMVKRDARIPQEAIAFVKKMLKGRKSFEPIFPFDRTYSFRMYKNYLGTCPHAMRHSRVSQFINKIEMNPVEICQLMEWNSTDMASRYMHVNKTKILNKL